MNTARFRQITIFRDGKQVAIGKLVYGLIGAPGRRGSVWYTIVDCDEDQLSDETCEAIGDAIDRGRGSARRPDGLYRWVVESK